MTAKIIGMPDRSSCRPALARSTVFGSTGSDCGIQMLFPSSETDGTAMLHSVAIIHNPVHNRIQALPGRATKTSSRRFATYLPLISSNTPAAGISRTPSPQFSI